MAFAACELPATGTDLWGSGESTGKERVPEKEPYVEQVSEVYQAGPGAATKTQAANEGTPPVAISQTL